jgi:NADH-quinone oxidoreductase subunit C
MTIPDAALQEALTARDGALLSWDEERGEASATIAREALLDTCVWLKETQGYGRLSGLLGIDTLKYPVAMPGQEARGVPRFGVIYHLGSWPPAPERLRLRVFLPEGDPVVSSVVSVWPGANYFEREVYDLLGIVFSGHPDLRRIMLPPEWVGHPLRKDVSIGGEGVEFSHTAAEITSKRRKARE